MAKSQKESTIEEENSTLTSKASIGSKQATKRKSSTARLSDNKDAMPKKVSKQSGTPPIVDLLILKQLNQVKAIEPTKSESGTKSNYEKRQEKKARQKLYKAVGPATVLVTLDDTKTLEKLQDNAAPKEPKKAPAPSPSNKKKPIKLAATLTRFSELYKQKLAASERVLFITLSKQIQHQRNTLFAKLNKFIVDEKPLGLKRVTPSAASFYTIVFDTIEHIKQALRTFERAKFKVNNKEIPIFVEQFGTKKVYGKTVWIVYASPLADLNDIQSIVTEHLQSIQPVDQQSEITVAAKLEREIETGAQGILF